MIRTCISIGVLALTLLGATSQRASAQVVIAPSLPTTTTPTDAQKARTRKAYDKARQAYQRRRYKEALRWAKTAWATTPNASTALIVATIYGVMNKPCESLEYLLLSNDLGPGDDERSRIVSSLAQQAPRCDPRTPLGWLVVQPVPAAATIRVAGVVLEGRRTIAISEGHYEVRFSGEGLIPTAIEVDVVRGAGAVAAARLQKAPVEEPAPGIDKSGRVAGRLIAEAGRRLPLARADPLPTREVDRTAAWSLLATGGVLLAGGGVLFGVAVGAVDDANELAAQPPGTPGREDAYNRAADRAQNFEIAAWVTGGLGLALALSGTILALTAEPEDVRVAPAVSSQGAGLTGHFRF